MSNVRSVSTFLYFRPVIRDARPPDVPDLLRLIRALAEYEREPGAVETTPEDLAAALFCSDPSVFALVAERAGRVVGMAVWFLTYSTWTGRSTLHLEDLYVEPDHRGDGLGRALVQSLAARAGDLGCARMEWAVLDWNGPAIGFYRSLGAHPLEEWTTWRLDLPGLRALGSDERG